VGTHFPVFRYEKSENPQNVMIAYVKLNEKCEIQNDEKYHSGLSVYWLMDGRRYKPVHRWIQQGIRERVDNVVEDHRSFLLRLKNPQVFRDDLDTRDIEVVAKPVKDGCEASAFVDVQTDAGKKKIKLTKIYAESKKTLLPPFRKVLAVSFTGVDPESGNVIERRFNVR
jgi:hypothetical protein